ncbi:aminoglycoside phosphotransferase family protein [Arthrobacter sp. PM3]|uniref:aminoglycoside phosphotransferase family protein n=1 Tax=Arthrobacter sp. PM3 TaxID=2017685 RepID=UPI001ABF37B0|nr:aminoglycoside phosphotransferase family protein [Arthrobacter sp. PM3]
MNTLDPETSPAWPAVIRAWPHLPWDRAAFGHGAFHNVAVLGTSAVVRFSRGAGHVARAKGEYQNLKALEGAALPVRIPVALSRPVSGPSWSAQANSFVPGEHRTGLCWEEIREPLDLLLNGFRAAAASAGELRPVRQWCGGQQWPAVVDRIIQPLDRATRTAAGRVVANVLEAEAGVETALVHGDFGPHNILWRGDQLSGVIDLDNACIGDPALDLAPLIGSFGSARVADIANRDLRSRARTHRASLPLQVAAAAELVSDTKLRDFALGNFQERFEAGTLQDPYLT